MSVLIVDIDDNLMPWYQPVDTACRAAGLGTEPAKSWRMWEDYGCELNDWLEVVNTLVVPGGLYHTPPYEGAAEALRALAWEGHEIHLVTARGFMDHAEQIRQWTHDWQEEWAIPGVLTFAKDKDRVALEIGADYAVDDGIHNYEMLWGVNVKTWLMNQPHNEGFDVDFRVSSIPEWADIIRTEAA